MGRTPVGLIRITESVGLLSRSNATNSSTNAANSPTATKVLSIGQSIRPFNIPSPKDMSSVFIAISFALLGLPLKATVSIEHANHAALALPERIKINDGQAAYQRRRLPRG
jgi:hypothetical protein